MKRLVAVFAVSALAFSSCTGSGEDPQVAQKGRRAEVSAADRLACGNIAQQLQRVRRGYVEGRSPDISLLPREPHYIGSAAKPVHTGPWDFLAEVPLVVYGPDVIEGRGSVGGPATMADVAPTIAKLIDFPFDAPSGRPLDVGRVRDVPRLVVTVVWDGGGWNTLREHADRWPTLSAVMEQGTSFTDFEIGSTPSNTPPIHTTLGTGAFPRVHGIAAVKMEVAGEYVDPYEGNNAALLEVPTLADVYDRERGNEPLAGVVATVNWHLGMLGHGAGLEGGDRDISLLLDDSGGTYGDASLYEIPSVGGASLDAETERLDASDGERDERWGDIDLSDPAIRYASPAYVRFQEQVLLDLIGERGFGRDATPDLLFTNFKSIDDAGHRWGMTSDQTANVLQATDGSLRRIIRGLDDTVGRGRWVLLLTADHGQNIYPEESGAWPIRGGELNDDIDRALDELDNGTDLITRVTSAGAYVDEREAARNKVSLGDIARWVAGYTVGENVVDEKLPPRWRERREEPLFDAVVPGRGEAVVSCVRDDQP